jgi:predicted phage-related endonuclease
LASLYPTETLMKSVDLSGENHLPVLLAERAELNGQIKVAGKRVDEINTEIKFKLGDAEAAMLPGWNITWKTRAGYVANVKPTRVLRITDHRL